MKVTFTLLFCSLAAWLSLGTPVLRAEDKKDATDHVISMGDGKLNITAPDKWKRVQPKSRIIEHEFAVPAIEPDKQDGRVTVMGAGGSVDDNIARWIGQFSADSGESLKPKVDKKTVAGQEVHLVDVAGTFKEAMGGPFAGGAVVERPDYRMLAAIIVSKEGNYFVKFYGPAKTVGESAEGFQKMIDGLQAK